MGVRIEIDRAVNGTWYYRVINDKNNRTLCTSETYSGGRYGAERAAQDLIDALDESVGGNRVIEVKIVASNEG